MTKDEVLKEFSERSRYQPSDFENVIFVEKEDAIRITLKSGGTIWFQSKSHKKGGENVDLWGY